MAKKNKDGETDKGARAEEKELTEKKPKQEVGKKTKKAKKR